jgi:ArsR family transcriptional regulator
MKRPLDPDVQLLQAAADPVRLSILRQLSSDGPTCACDFTDCCDISQPTVSHHLKVLREAGWISGERRGTWIWYSIRPEAVERLGAIAGDIRPGGARPVATPLAASPTTTPAADDPRALPVLEADWRQW